MEKKIQTSFTTAHPQSYCFKSRGPNHMANHRNADKESKTHGKTQPASQQSFNISDMILQSNGRRQAKGITFILFQRKKQNLGWWTKCPCTAQEAESSQLPTFFLLWFLHPHSRDSFAVSSSPSLSLISAFHSALPLLLSILLAPLSIPTGLFFWNASRQLYSLLFSPIFLPPLLCSSQPSFNRPFYLSFLPRILLSSPFSPPRKLSRLSLVF